MWNLCWLLVVLLVDWCFSFFFLNISVVCNYGVLRLFWKLRKWICCAFVACIWVYLFSERSLEHGMLGFDERTDFVFDY